MLSLLLKFLNRNGENRERLLLLLFFSSFLLLRFASLNLKINIYIYIYICILIYYGYLISFFDLVLLAVILEILFDNNNGCFFFTSFVFSFLNFVPFLEGNFKILTPQCHGHAAHNWNPYCITVAHNWRGVAWTDILLLNLSFNQCQCS